jgi:hypothetical protein
LRDRRCKGETNPGNAGGLCENPVGGHLLPIKSERSQMKLLASPAI